MARARRLSHKAVLLTTSILSTHASLAQTLPKGGQVIAGSAAIAQPTANQMVITQSTQRVAINWQSFNIGAGYGVQFVQPSSSAIALNRVVGLSGPSQILGSLTANGQVYIVNPSGVVFGKGAMINTGALVATTRDISTSQFMAGGNDHAVGRVERQRRGGERRDDRDGRGRLRGAGGRSGREQGHDQYAGW